MVFVSLDSIVKNVLLQRGYPMHFYIQFLVAAKDIARELIFDDLGVVNTAVLTLDENKAAKLPDDYVDWTKVGVRAGQTLKPLIEQDSMIRVSDADTIAQPNLVQTYIPNVYYYQTRFNDYGENIGRDYGNNAFYSDTYKIIKERGIIQCNNFLPSTQIIMEYVSNGSCIMATIGVEPYAQKTIESYIIWQMKEVNRNIGLGERDVAKREYEKQRKVLRARMNSLTPDAILRIANQNYTTAPK